MLGRRMVGRVRRQEETLISRGPTGLSLSGKPQGESGALPGSSC
jgi:hypothetical protein